MLIATAGLLASCSSDDREAIAAAKCSLPVDQAAGFSDDERPERTLVEVTSLGEGSYRVTGFASSAETTVEFLCEVAPDASDKLRGFTVTKLDVHPAE